MGTDQWPFIGHHQFGQMAIRLQDEGRWPSVTLLRGPAHIGKTTIVHWLAQRALCQSTTRPCGTCVDCRAMNEHRHPRCFILDGSVESIGIEAVRSVQQELRIKSQQLRVVLLLSAHRMTEAAANSVLKVFEEPPEHVQILATSDRPGMIPATVRSRMQQYYVRPISKHDVTAEDRSALLAAEGRIGLVQEWKASPEILRQQQVYAEEFLQSLLGEQRPSVTEDIEERLDVEAMVVRTLLFQQLGIRRPMPWSVPPALLDRVQQQLPFATLVHTLDAYHQRHAYFLTNVSPRNVYEDLHQRF